MLILVENWPEQMFQGHGHSMKVKGQGYLKILFCSEVMLRSIFKRLALIQAENWHGLTFHVQGHISKVKGQDAML